MSSIDTRSGRAWTLVLHLGADAWVGLAGDELCVGDINKPKRRIDPADPVGLLPLLERPYDGVVEELHEREQALGLPRGSLSRRVPLATIPVAAVQAGSDYWSALALAWFAALPQSEAQTAALNELETAGWASQRVRHRARRIRKADE